MRPMAMGLFVSLLTTTLLVTFSTVRAQDGSRNDAAKALHALFAAEWDYRMEQNPTWASVLGDRRWNDRWPDVSLSAIEKRHQHNRDVLTRLKAIDRAQLSPQDQLNYDLFRKEYKTSVEEYKYRWYFVPLNQRGGIQTADELAASLRFQTLKDYEDWIARLRALPSYMDQTTALMREGAKARMILPKVVMQRVPAQIDKQIVEDPQASPFYKPFKNFPDSIQAAERERLEQSARQAISSSVIPAFKQFKQF
ncbi:MAG TPA: DUF885 family protein, partial [Pyrinomonadaceae bacterium]|nr:DUF885 family protein [Pyrinomonadaceae bacterium]